ncbi:hypothetical protein [Salinicola aestuarinus]|uniref:hypothetical protein n=1 Tax=Salinicola aestuarinus TaxID=1949082 RepID=UPI000DA13268|nr:hypothetical protein [Salinicola aestuarinus]
MKYRLWMLPAVALGSGLSAGAMANDATLSQGDLAALLSQSSQYGFSRYEKLETDADDGELEIEGWRENGWALDASLALEDGALMRERQRQSTLPDWSLTGDELTVALDTARRRGLESIDELEVDSDGHIEIEGYDASGGDLDVDLPRDALASH